jgi:hypothetical protein
MEDFQKQKRIKIKKEEKVEKVEKNRICTLIR